MIPQLFHHLISRKKTKHNRGRSGNDCLYKHLNIKSATYYFHLRKKDDQIYLRFLTFSRDNNLKGKNPKCT